MQDCYIVIEGAIGVGKTTLARMIEDRLQTRLILEVFEENPFLAKFYESRARYAFQTQMFFLLSRYRQQQEVAQLLRSPGSLVSDYMFAKDRLFAELTLAEDEWDIYQQIHGALAEQIPRPDLIVYLQADTDVLMARIAQRDRPYERGMDRDYIEALRQAYDRYFADLRGIPLLTIDTNNLNFVAHPADFRSISGRIQGFLREGIVQPRLLPEERPAEGKAPLAQGRPIAELQRFHVELDKSKGFNTNVYFNFLCLSEEIGELGSELAQLWRVEEALITRGLSVEQARSQALTEQKQTLKAELADCMAYLLKLANYTGIELEAAYVEKMNQNRTRVWDSPGSSRQDLSTS